MITKVTSLKDRGENIEDLMKDKDLLEAADVIKAGGLVAFPTETVYGLGANALDATAADRIYAAKGRPSDNPLIVHISSMDELYPLVKEVPAAAEKLAEIYWPGPMTMVLEKDDKIPDRTTGGLDTVAVRMPSDPVARAFIKLSGVPIAAPSANISGRPSPTRAGHVKEDLDGRIDMIIDGGPVGIGVESTIIDLTGDTPTLLRPGAVTFEMLTDTLGKVNVDPAIKGPLSEDEHPKAPGMKYRHYAPKADMTIVEGEAEKVASYINEKTEEALREGKRAGIICTDESKDFYPAGIVRTVGTRNDEDTVAHNLFAVLREFDDLGADIIFSESFPENDIGQAIMNRLSKAAGYRIITV